eukprot:2485558-Pyramimonas_sp.AAC.1
MYSAWQTCHIQASTTLGGESPLETIDVRGLGRAAHLRVVEVLLGEVVGADGLAELEVEPLGVGQEGDPAQPTGNGGDHVHWVYGVLAVLAQPRA